MINHREEKLIHALRERLCREEKAVLVGAFIEMFLHLSRENQDGCIKFMEEFPRMLRFLQGQQDKGKISIEREKD